MNSTLTVLKIKAEQARQTHAYRAEGASIRFTEDLVEAMESSGLTRSALAEKIGTSPATITKILKGETNFPLDSMVKIAHALNCELSIDLHLVAAAETSGQRPTVSYHDTALLPSLILNDKPKG